MDKGANMIWHLSAAVEVLGQAAYAAETNRDPIELAKRGQIEGIVGHVQSIIATIERERAERVEATRVASNVSADGAAWAHRTMWPHMTTEQVAEAMRSGDEADDIIDDQEAVEVEKEETSFYDATR